MRVGAIALTVSFDRARFALCCGSWRSCGGGARSARHSNSIRWDSPEWHGDGVGRLAIV